MENNSSPQPQDTNSNPEIAPSETPQPILPPSVKPKKNKLAIILLVIILVVAGGIAAIYVLMKDDKKIDTNTQNQSTEQTEHSDQHTANDHQHDATEIHEEDETSLLNCGEYFDNASQFADEEFGATFCYPSEWGTASVMDAKIDVSDTGHREAVRFSGNTLFIVGGVSDDWTTTVGRDVGCQEPSSRVPELSEYNTDWNNISGSGMDVDYAQRSIAVSEGGYDITETVSNMLWSGVCAQGHKVINGPRYRVISAAFYRDFSEAAGITTPKAHMDNSSVLFSSEQRTQLDKLLSSVAPY